MGVTAAYKLALKGHSVALLEPRERAGEECSACAAGTYGIRCRVVSISLQVQCHNIQYNYDVTNAAFILFAFLP